MPIRDRVNNEGIKVAVLCGGPGGERDVSLASGETAHRALVRAGMRNEKVVVPATDPADFLEKVDCRIAVMMLHGVFGEDGTAQEILERRGIAYTGSAPASCRLAMDKSACKKLFQANGVPTQPWIVSDDPATVVQAASEKGLVYPLFVKPNHGGSSVGVSRVDEPGLLAEAVARTLEVDRLALVEEMVIGRELTVGWLDGQVLPVIEMIAEGAFYDYNAKYVSPATKYICPAKIPEGVAAAVAADTAKVAKLLGSRDLARVDVLLGGDGPRFLELNSLPGFTGHSLFPMAARVAGIDIETLCTALVEKAARRVGII